ADRARIAEHALLQRLARRQLPQAEGLQQGFRQAVVVPREAELAVGDAALAQVRVGAEVEQDLRLEPDDVVAVDAADAGQYLLVHRLQLVALEVRAALRAGAARPVAAGPGLVDQLVAHQVILGGPARRDRHPGRAVVVLQA